MKGGIYVVNQYHTLLVTDLLFMLSDKCKKFNHTERLWGLNKLKSIKSLKELEMLHQCFGVEFNKRFKANIA